MLLFFLCLISVLLTAVTCWALPLRNAWLIPVSVGFFAAYLIGLIILGVIYLFVSSWMLPKNEVPAKKSRYAFAVIKAVCTMVVQISRMNLTVSGLDSVPEGPFLLVANHRSNLDPMLTISLLKKNPIAFITKEGNKKIPIAGPYIRRAGFLTIDRENPRNAVKTIQTAAQLIQRDRVSYGIYPEGTRNRTEQTLLPFHEGVFMIAQKARVPVVVAATKNTEQIAKRFPLHSTNVSFAVLRVYSAEEVRSRRTADLSSEAYREILRHLEESDSGIENSKKQGRA